MKQLTILLLLLFFFSFETVEAHTPFKLMTFNIQSGSGFDQVYNLTRQAQVIIQEGPLLVALQEVDNMTQRHAGDDQLSILSGMTGMKQYRFAKFRPFQGGAYGIGILSRLEIIDSVILHYQKPSYYRSKKIKSDPLELLSELKEKEEQDERCAKYAPDDYCQGALAVLVRLPQSDEYLWFVTTHLGLKGVQEEEARQLVHNLIVPLQKHSQYPQSHIIVTGDFNSEPDSEAVQIVLKEARVTDSWERCGKGGKVNGYTFNSHRPYERIDYQLMHSPEHNNDLRLDCLDARVPETEASDHRPYLVTYRLSNSKNSQY